MFSDKRILTGVKPTGTPHIGNYLAAIKPAIGLSVDAKQHTMFIADYHAINSIKDPQILSQKIKEVACTYLACGLDTNKSIFYRQSDIPEILEIATILYAFTPKGLMNKSHAYKASVDKNKALGKHDDDGINMGLYTYPTLMAADILAFDTEIVPVGKDQVQHVEIARDIAGAINAYYKKNILTLPQYVVEDNLATILGIDGQKMSKSYNNVIPLFAEEKELKKVIFSIKTDSRAKEEPKEPQNVLIYKIYEQIASPEQAQEMAQGLREGKLGYGDIKNMLLNSILDQTKDIKEKFDYHMAHYDDVKAILAQGAGKARPIAQEVLSRLKNTIFSTL